MLLLLALLLALDGATATILPEDIVAAHPLADLTSSELIAGNQFGSSVSTEGDLIAIGTPRIISIVAAKQRAGRAFIFNRNTGGFWTFGEQAQIEASDRSTDAYFGTAVSLSSPRIAISAVGVEKLYIYRNDGDELTPLYTEVDILDPTGGEVSPGDKFGTAVSMSGTTVAASSPDGKVGGTNAVGHVYIFKIGVCGTDACWGQVADIECPVEQGGAKFGHSLALSGDLLLVGARGLGATGTAYLNGRNQNGPEVWGVVATLLPGTPSTTTSFGYSVAFTGGNLLVIGTMGDEQAWVFEGLGGAWEGTKLEVQGPSPGANPDFGMGVAINTDGLIVVGAPFAEVDGVAVGAAYLFQRDVNAEGQPWVQTGQVLSSQPVDQGEFGGVLGLTGDTLVAGAQKEYTGAGRAYVWRLVAPGPPTGLGLIFPLLKWLTIGGVVSLLALAGVAGVIMVRGRSTELPQKSRGGGGGGGSDDVEKDPMFEFSSDVPGKRRASLVSGMSLASGVSLSTASSTDSDDWRIRKEDEESTLEGRSRAQSKKSAGSRKGMQSRQ